MLSIQSGVVLLVNQSLGYVKDLVLIALEAVVVMVYAVVRLYNTIVDFTSEGLFPLVSNMAMVTRCRSYHFFQVYRSISFKSSISFLKNSAIINIFVLRRFIKWRCQNIDVRLIGINWEAIKGDGKALKVNGELLKRNEDAPYGM